MKKAIISLMAVSLILSSAVGCSSRKSKEVLGEEIKVDLEVELKENKNNAKGDEKEIAEKNEMGQEDNFKVEIKQADIRDMDRLYGFVRTEIVDITREQFDTWEVYYFDITKDGTDEAVLVSIYGVNWHNRMEIISLDSGEFKRILSEIPLGRDKNIPELQDGFLSVLASTNETGEQFTGMQLYIYNDSKIIQVVKGLDISYTVSFPDVKFKEIGEIDGDLTNFTYTLTKYDELTEKETIEKKEVYKYNPDNMSFEVKNIKN